MGTTVKGIFKGLRYITQIFDEDKDKDMQIGFPTDVKHVAHIGSDGPIANTPSWMSDFKPQEIENGQVVSRGDVNNNPIGEGVGLQELLPPPERRKQKKSRRKSDASSQTGSPPRRSSNVSSSDVMPRHSRRHNRSRHGSMDSSNDASVRRRRSAAVPETDAESSYALSDGSVHSRKSSTRNRKLKGSAAGELSMRKTKTKPENSTVQSGDKCNDYTSDKD